MKKIFIPLAIILVFSSLLITTTATADTPVSGGTLRSRMLINPRSLGYPPTMIGPDGGIASFAIDSLFKLDRNGNIDPMLATEWKIDTAAKTVTIILRKGVKFHDGSDFNAEVCKWNLDQFRSGRSKELKPIASIDIIDDYAVRLNLAQYQNTLIANLAQLPPGGMISKASFDANGGKDWCQKNPVGTGPFKFVSWKKDVAVKFTRNEAYWDGAPYLDGITFSKYADNAVALMDLKAGNLDTSSISPFDVADLQASGGFFIEFTPTGQKPALAGNYSDPKSPFRDIRVRRAMSYAIDVKTLADLFGHGTYMVQNQWAIPGTWAYNPNIVGYPYNPEKAKKLLAEAGYPNGFKTKLHFNNLKAEYLDKATAFQTYLKAVGIDTELVVLKSASYNEIAKMGKGFSGIVWEMNRGQVDPLITYATIVTGREFNGMLKPQEFKDIYFKALAAPDKDSKQKLVHQLLYLATDKYCMTTHLWAEQQAIAVTNKLKNYSIAPTGRLDLSKAWISK